MAEAKTVGNSVVSYDEALAKSLVYFGGETLPPKVFLDKYALQDNDSNLLESTPEEMHRRMAKEFARAESKKFKAPWAEDEIFKMFDKFGPIVPQGSPMYGIGNPFQYSSLGNCFVLPAPQDSYSSILDVDHALVQVSKRRGGTGVDISNLRPAGSPTKNAARTSTGISVFMERFSNSIREVGQNGRRGALMLTLSVHHPEVLTFASIKRDLKKVTGANISLRLSDEFLRAVERDGDYELRFPVDYKERGIKPIFSSKVKAREVWLKIIENAWAMAEPGLMFWDRIISESPSDCYSDLGYRTISTNPCGELPLSAYSSCRLMVVNVLSCVDDPYTQKAKFDFDRLYLYAGQCQRLMDDMIDLEVESLDRIISKIKNDPEDKTLLDREIQIWESIKRDALEARRTGSGQTALADAMAAVGIKYGSDESIKFTEKVYRTLKLGAYRSSVDMAKELGAFPIWDAKREVENPFLLRISKEDPELYADMQKYGRRNISLLTTAPAGSVSILTQTSSGIEPLFKISHTRRKKGNPGDKNFRTDFVDPNGDHWMHFEIYHPQVKRWMAVTGETDIKKSPWWGACAEELDWGNRIKIQAAAQKHIDHSISSTLNLPNDVTVEKVAEIYETAWKAGLKGITVYRDKCRDGVLVDLTPATGGNGREASKVPKTTAPKRPQALPAAVYHFTAKGKPYYAAVGLFNGDPYETFTGINGEGVTIPKEVESGKIVKQARGNSRREGSDGKNYPLMGAQADDNAAALTRVLSTALRHGADISFIVHQLEKTRGDMQTFSKVVSRALKNQIRNGTKVHGEACSCGSHNLERQAGCVTCKDCGASKCS